MRVLTRKLSTHRYFSCETHFGFFFFENCCVSLFVRLPHTLGGAVRRCSLQCLFHQIQGNSTTPSDTQDVLYDGRQRNAKRQENKKNKKTPPLLISAKCVSFTARFKLMALILSAPKNPRYNANFQCHWIRLRVWRRRRRAGKG